MLEKKIEQYLRDQIEKLGGKAYKFKSPGYNHVPDRLCILPYNVILFVEVKAPNGVVSKGQQHEFNRLASYGAKLFIVRNKEHVDRLVKHLKEQQEKLQALDKAQQAAEKKKESRIIQLN